MHSSILLNIPHSSITNYHKGWIGKYKMFDVVKTWTDWHTEILFATDNDNSKIKSIVCPFSRFFCDVERLFDDPLNEKGQGIFYTSFEGYTRDKGTEVEKDSMLCYNTYIDALKRKITPDTLIIDCHSFPSLISDVDICIGFNNDWSYPTDNTVNLIADAFKKHGFTVGINNPYANSITPDTERTDYKTVMIEINKKLYMNEDTLNITTHNFDIIHKTLNKLYLLLLKD